MLLLHEQLPTPWRGCHYVAAAQGDRVGSWFVRLRRVLAASVTTLVCAGVLVATSGSGRIADRELVGSVPTPVPGPRSGQTRTAALRVVALGDSVTGGTACNCSAFPAVYGGLLGRRTGSQVTVDNLGVSGLDSAGLLGQLDQADSAEARAVKGADIVLLTIGANDFGDHHDDVTEARCASTAGGDCVSDELEQLSSNLHRILTGIRTLREAKATTVLVTGYWNVYEDGEVARQAFPPEGVAATVELTRRVNTVIAAVCASHGAAFVDLFGPFEKDGVGVTRLLAADGDHPNAAGHLLIAQVLAKAGLPKLPAG
jgi:lysophospholipase L1-like esterase